ncbi:MAG: hypothetical protein JWP81_437 [Ferruginibacter sp.]|nr:hypothetical protein [Ferruginibacter sp.]
MVSGNVGHFSFEDVTATNAPMNTKYCALKAVFLFPAMSLLGFVQSRGRCVWR